MKSTKEADYTESLLNRQSVWWKRILDVQAPYRWHIRSLRTKHLLDVGCGIGRNLQHLNGAGIGVDHNQTSVDFCRKNGFEAFTFGDFLRSAYAIPESFDTILLAHVAEHMNPADFGSLVDDYHPYLKHGGRFVVITPQEAGFRSDPTHVTFVSHREVAAVMDRRGYQIKKNYSFPFPRFTGCVFKYNEFVTIAQKI